VPIVAVHLKYAEDKSFRQRLIRATRTFLKDESGANAVEFALIAGPFLVLLVGLLEVCMIFIVTTTLEHGAAEATRQIRTGELQNAGASAEAFKTIVCDNTFGLLDCDDQLKVDVRVFDTFGNTSGNDPLADGELTDDDMAFDAGEGSDIILARVYYEWNIITPVLGRAMANMGTDKRLLQASVAFRNEPFALGGG
jgi:Flp pilus assembly protein TadG